MKIKKKRKEPKDTINEKDVQSWAATQYANGGSIEENKQALKAVQGKINTSLKQEQNYRDNFTKYLESVKEDKSFGEHVHDYVQQTCKGGFDCIAQATTELKNSGYLDKIYTSNSAFSDDVKNGKIKNFKLISGTEQSRAELKKGDLVQLTYQNKKGVSGLPHHAMPINYATPDSASYIGNQGNASGSNGAHPINEYNFTKGNFQIITPAFVDNSLYKTRDSLKSVLHKQDPTFENPNYKPRYKDYKQMSLEVPVKDLNNPIEGYSAHRQEDLYKPILDKQKELMQKYNISQQEFSALLPRLSGIGKQETKAGSIESLKYDVKRTPVVGDIAQFLGKIGSGKFKEAFDSGEYSKGIWQTKENYVPKDSQYERGSVDEAFATLVDRYKHEVPNKYKGTDEGYNLAVSKYKGLQSSHNEYVKNVLDKSKDYVFKTDNFREPALQYTPEKNYRIDPKMNPMGSTPVPPEFKNGGKNVNTLEGDLYSKVLMNRNKNLDFVQRANAVGQYPESNMFQQFDPNEFGQKNSHLMGWGEDENGQAYMSPSIFNDKNEAIKVPNQYADYISSIGYKHATGIPTKQNGGSIGKWEIIEDLPKAGNGYKWSDDKSTTKPIMQPQNNVNISQTIGNRKLTSKEVEANRASMEAYNKNIVQEEYNNRKNRIQESIQAKEQPLSLKNLQTQSQSIGDKFSLAMNTKYGNPKDYPTLSGYMEGLDYINPAKIIGDMSSGIGSVPQDINEGNYLKAGMSIGSPLFTGAVAGIGTKGIKPFVNNLTNPLAGTGEIIDNLGNRYLPNAYKKNPFAFKTNPNKFYRQVDDETFQEGLESRVIKGKQNIGDGGMDGININKAFGDDAYYNKGRLYYKNNKDLPYLFEANLPEENFIPKVNGRTRKYTTENTSVRVSKEPLSIDNPDITIYKKNWLKGYKPIELPKKEFGGNIITENEWEIVNDSKTKLPKRKLNLKKSNSDWEIIG